MKTEVETLREEIKTMRVFSTGLSPSENEFDKFDGAMGMVEGGFETVGDWGF